MVMGRCIGAPGHHGELDVLFVDLPPGMEMRSSPWYKLWTCRCGHRHHTSEVALADAVRGIQMFRKLDVPLLGLVQNMAYYQLPDGAKDYVFEEDGGVRRRPLPDRDPRQAPPTRRSEEAATRASCAG